MHVRQQIREAVTALVAAIPAIGGRAHASRVYPMQNLPAAAIYVDTDTVLSESGVTGGGRFDQLRDLLLRIDLFAAGSEGMDSQLDSLCVAVEAAMVVDETLGGLCEWLQLSETDFIFDGESEQPKGVASLSYTVTYRVRASDPETVID